MLYPNLEAAMAARHVTLAQIAQCAHVDEKTASEWTREGPVQMPVQAAFAVQGGLFPEYSVEELFALESA